MEPPSGTGLSIPGLGSLASQTVPFMWPVSLVYPPAFGYLAWVFLEAHPPMWIWVRFTSSSHLCWEEPVVRELACLMAYPHTRVETTAVGVWGSPVDSGSWGWLVPEPG